MFGRYYCFVWVFRAGIIGINRWKETNKEKNKKEKRKKQIKKKRNKKRRKRKTYWKQAIREGY